MDQKDLLFKYRKFISTDSSAADTANPDKKTDWTEREASLTALQECFTTFHNEEGQNVDWQ